MNSSLEQGGASINPIRFLAVAVLFVFGCQAVPTVTRTGNLKDIIIGDNLSGGEVVVSPGDEVRWVNKRTAPVRIVFLDPISDKQLSCINNFGGLMTPSNTAKLASNETASACFRDPGYVRYTGRMEAANMAGERNVPGVVKVGGQATGYTSEPNTGRSSEEAGNRTINQPTDQTSGPPSSMSTTTTTTITTFSGEACNEVVVPAVGRSMKDNGLV